MEEVWNPARSAFQVVSDALVILSERADRSRSGVGATAGDAGIGRLLEAQLGGVDRQQMIGKVTAVRRAHEDELILESIQRSAGLATFQNPCRSGIVKVSSIIVKRIWR